MAAVISLTILATSSYILIASFRTAGTEQVETYNRQKDVLLFTLPFLGTVTGYYLGRVPAEQRAQQASQSAQQAQQQLSGVQTRLVRATTQAADSQRQAAHAVEEQQRLRTQVRSTLKSVQESLRSALAAPPALANSIGAEIVPPATSTDHLRDAKVQVEQLLRQLD
jgi:hypothetical protein